MGKLLMWVVIILAILVIIRIVAARNSAKRSNPPPSPRPAATPTGQTKAESMVRCAYCGVHLPRSEATLINGKTWCDQEHAKLGNN